MMMHLRVSAYASLYLFGYVEIISKNLQQKYHIDIMQGYFGLSTVGDGEFLPYPNSISTATKSEPSDNHASHSFGNGYKAIPVN